MCLCVCGLYVYMCVYACVVCMCLCVWVWFICTFMCGYLQVTRSTIIHVMCLVSNECFSLLIKDVINHLYTSIFPSRFGPYIQGLADGGIINLTS